MLRYLALTMAMIIVGTSVTISRYLALELPVFLITLLRFSVAMLCLLPFAPSALKRLSSVGFKTHRILVAQAFFGVVVFSVALLFGLRFIDANKAGIITATTPAMIYLLSIMLLGEKRNRLHDASIAAAVIAILFLNIDMKSFDTGKQMQWEALLGAILILIAVFGEALFTIFRKPISESVSPMDNTIAVTFWALIMMLPLGVWDFTNHHIDLSPRHMAAIVYMGALVTVVAFLLWFYGVGQVPAGTASAFTAFIPLSAVFSANLLLNESLEWKDSVALVLVLLGIYLGVRAEQKIVLLVRQETTSVK